MTASSRLTAGSLPRTIYHLADAANWPSIERHGLLSTHALLDLAGVWGDERRRFEHEQRTMQMELPNGVIIRDQKPLPPQALERCLRDMSPTEWYTLLNAQVFFWLDSERLNRMRRASWQRAQVVLMIDSERLVARYAEHIALSPINTGNARRQPAMRGRQTFVPYPTWIDSGWASEAESLGTRRRPRGHAPVELTISGAVFDVMDFVVDVRRLDAGQPFLVSLRS